MHHHDSTSIMDDGCAIETVLELWASSLRDVKRRMCPCLHRRHGGECVRVRERTAERRSAQDWLDAGETAGDPGPWRQQELLGRDRWDADALRDLVRNYVVEHLGDEDAVLVVDETG
jgi:SRSO17 transposase